MNANHLPFGMLFAEVAPSPSYEQVLVPEYDSRAEISLIATDTGERVPYITLSVSTSGTQTITEIRTETTDTDPGDNRPMFATQSVTNVRAEITDTDPADDCPILATQTETRVHAELTDKD